MTRDRDEWHENLKACTRSEWSQAAYVDNNDESLGLHIRIKYPLYIDCYLQVYLRGRVCVCVWICILYDDSLLFSFI